MFSEPTANGRTGVGEVRPPIAFGAGDDSKGAVAVPLDKDGKVVRPSARAELAERAALRREREGVVRNRATGSVWNDFRAGAAGTAAGVAGVAATSGEAEALPETEANKVISPVVVSKEASAPTQEAIGFSDVPATYWAKPYIDSLSSRGLIAGFDNGTFRPDEPVTRAQVANIVSKTFDLTADKKNLEFSDVDSKYWARESIDEVVKGGFMAGFPGGVFKPNEPVTRAQALTTLVTGLGIAPPTNVQPTLSRYTDAATIPKWATDKVAAATAGSLVVNYPKLDQIKANQSTTRAELSAIIYQALAREGVVEPVESEYVVKP